ncbi:MULTISPECIES: dTMP kinase [unclassified Pseudofrankia]|uniref:dTMP kinase n=1 Tax=unclassified Pseudofrankia TaxID=2994372 RepID=UPI0009F36AC3|nr:MULTISPECIES: dTMP kinase [unclassified Pseudofrankia]MDT3444865.1 dTMP kinase [Pseudofrankia sp. BMG5.37]
MPKLIILTGVDGAGKTTLAHWLADELTATGTPARYFKNAAGRRIVNRVAQRLGLRDGGRLLGRHGRVVAETLCRWVTIARAILLTVVTRRTAVMDRYTYCQYAMIRARGDRGERIARALYTTFPRPDITFYLAVPAQEAARRVEARGRDLEDPAHLAAYDDAYRALSEFDDFVVIDASAPQHLVARALREHLDSTHQGQA